MIQIVPKAHHNSSFLIFHSSFPSCGEGIKNTHPLKRIRGGIQMYSTVPPWLRQKPSLIGALTGAPVRAFLPCGSEVVSLSAGVRMPCTKVAPSLGIFRSARVFITAFYEKIVAQFFCLVNHSGKKCPVEGCFCLSKSILVHK